MCWGVRSNGSGNGNWLIDSLYMYIEHAVAALRPGNPTEPNRPLRAGTAQRAAGTAFRHGTGHRHRAPAAARAARGGGRVARSRAGRVGASLRKSKLKPHRDLRLGGVSYTYSAL